MSSEEDEEDVDDNDKDENAKLELFSVFVSFFLSFV